MTRSQQRLHYWGYGTTLLLSGLYEQWMYFDVTVVDIETVMNNPPYVTKISVKRAGSEPRRPRLG